MPHGLRPRSPAHQDDAIHVDAMRGDPVDAVGHRTEQALDGRASDIGGIEVSSGHTMQRARGLREVRRAFTLEVRHQRESPGTGLRRHRQPVQFVEVHTEHRGDGGKHRGAVERAHKRQLPSGGVRETGHDALGVVRRDVTDRAHDARRAERDDAVTRACAQPEGRARVVPGARAENRTRRRATPPLAKDPARRELRAAGPASPIRAGRVDSRRTPREVPGSARVASVGAQIGDIGRTAQPPGQPVVRQAHRRRRIGVRGFVIGEPTQFGRRDRRDGHHADALRPLAAHPTRRRAHRPLRSIECRSTATHLARLRPRCQDTPCRAAARRRIPPPRRRGRPRR